MSKLQYNKNHTTGITFTFIGYKFWPQEEQEGEIQTSELHFMRRGPQPIGDCTTPWGSLS